MSFSAPYTNLRAGRRLTYLGTEGGVSSAVAAFQCYGCTGIYLPAGTTYPAVKSRGCNVTEIPVLCGSGPLTVSLPPGGANSPVTCTLDSPCYLTVWAPVGGIFKIQDETGSKTSFTVTCDQNK